MKKIFAVFAILVFLSGVAFAASNVDTSIPESLRFHWVLESMVEKGDIDDDQEMWAEMAGHTIVIGFDESSMTIENQPKLNYEKTTEKMTRISSNVLQSQRDGRYVIWCLNDEGTALSMMDSKDCAIRSHRGSLDHRPIVPEVPRYMLGLKETVPVSGDPLGGIVGVWKEYGNASGGSWNEYGIHIFTNEGNYFMINERDGYSFDYVATFELSGDQVAFKYIQPRNGEKQFTLPLDSFAVNGNEMTFGELLVRRMSAEGASDEKEAAAEPQPEKTEDKKEEKTEAEEETEIEEEIRKAKTKKANAKIRSEASKKSDLVATISKKGVVVTILGEEKGKDGYTWYYIEMEDGTRGYSRSDFFTLVK